MIPPISIDIRSVADEFHLSDEEIKQLSSFVLDSIIDGFMRHWENAIDKNLKGTRNEYKKGMFVDYAQDGTVSIGLTARQSGMAMKQEEGSPPFDMKEGFARSDKKHQGTKGWYIHIPFRWATTEALGESMIFSNKMPKPIQDLVKSQREALKISQIPKEFRGIGVNKTSGYVHKNNIYEALKRYESGSGSTEKRGQYMSFRTASENGDPGSWVHPGFKALNLIDNTMSSFPLDEIVDKAVDDFLANRD